MPLRSAPAALGLGLLALAACPTDQPVIPDRPATSGDDTTSTSGPSTGPSSADTSAGMPSSSGTTSADTTEDPPTTTGPAACELEQSCATGMGAWWDEDWTYRRRIQIASPLGGPLGDAVVPVRLEPDFDYACVDPDGADLRFVDDQGTVLAHELDEWSPQGSIAWVRVPMLGTEGASMWLYYGNPGAQAREAEVWPAAVGYEAVLHFGGDLDDARGLHDGQTPGVAPVFAGNGMLGQAIHYEPLLVDARTELSDSASIDDAIIASESLTATAWVRSTPHVDSPTPFRGVVGRGSDQWGMAIQDTQDGYDFLPPCYVLFNTDCVEPECEPLVDFANNHFLTGTTPVIENDVEAVWHHVAVVYEPMGMDYRKTIYVDGVLDGTPVTGPLPMPWDDLGLHLDPYTIGAGPTDSASVVYHGEIDEVHLASQAWGIDRVMAEYAYASDPMLVTLSGAECP